MPRFIRQLHAIPLRPIAKVLFVLALAAAIISGTMLVREFFPEKVEFAAAQTESGESFSSGSDGSDGALILTTPGTYLFQDPCSPNPPSEPPADYVCNFTDVQIGSGVTIQLSGQFLNGPVYWLATGTVQIDGIIDLNGATGHDSGAILGNRKPATAGAGGYPGGIGWNSNGEAQSGGGPGRGLPCTSGCFVFQIYPGFGGGGGAGYSSNAQLFSGFPGGVGYGNTYLVPFVGGSGGGGGKGNWTGGNTGNGAGGGGGGGAILVASSTSITVAGTISANGGNGGSSTISGGGGGGSGGAIFLTAPQIAGAGTLTASGGGGGVSNGRNGTAGRIRLEAFQQSFTGTSSPTPVYGSPIQVALLNNPPFVRVVSIATGGNIVPVPEFPTGEFDTPDVTISAGTPITINIEAHNIPLGEQVQLHIISENGADQVINSTPLTGSFTTSTATIVTTMPYGPSRMFVRSDYGWAFLPQQRYLAGNNPQEIVNGQFNSNEDNWLDIAVTDYLSAQVSVFLGNGDGSFQPQQFFATGTNPSGIAAGDVDNNGLTDLVVTNSGGNSITVLLGIGDGTFQPQTPISTGANTFPFSVVIANINSNADNIPDLAIVKNNSDNIAIFLGNGNGTFVDFQSFLVGDNPLQVIAEDFDEDGNIDLTTANSNSNNVSVLLGNGDGTFQGQQSYSMGVGVNSIAVADLNNDENLDLVTANHPAQTISVRLGYGDGNFQNALVFSTQRYPLSVLITEMNNDGVLDLMVINSYEGGHGTILVWLGKGDGTFQMDRFYLLGDGPSRGAVSDFNGDGLVDVVVANQSNDDISVLLHR